MMALLSIVPWYYRLAALAVLAVALVGYGWLKGAEYGERKLDTRIAAENVATIAGLKAAGEKTKAFQQKKDEALHAANERAKKAQVAAAAARATVDGLRSDLAAARNDMSSASLASIRKYAATLNAVFGECAAEVERLAGKAQGHASDALMFEQAWPR